VVLLIETLNLWIPGSVFFINGVFAQYTSIKNSIELFTIKNSIHVKIRLKIRFLKLPSLQFKSYSNSRRKWMSTMTGSLIPGCSCQHAQAFELDIISYKSTIRENFAASVCSDDHDSDPSLAYIISDRI
jgi:hypothetical protein